MRTWLLLAAALAAAAPASAGVPCSLDPKKDLAPLASIGMTQEKIDQLPPEQASDLCKSRALVRGQSKGAPAQPHLYMTSQELKESEKALADALMQEAERVFGRG